MTAFAHEFSPVALDLGLDKHGHCYRCCLIYGVKLGVPPVAQTVATRVDKACIAAAGKLIFESVQEDSIACSRLQ